MPVPKVPEQSLSDYNMALRLIDEIPSLKSLLAEALSMDRFPRNVVLKIVHRLEVLYSNIRSADTTKVKDAFARIAGKDSPEWAEWVKFEVVSSTEERGWVSPMTGKYLCPQMELPKFEADPQAYCNLARDRKIPETTHGQMLALAYDQDRRAAGTDAELGADFPSFMYGHMLPRALAHILKSTFGKSWSGSNAIGFGIHECTPELMAYAEAQCIFVLSASPNLHKMLSVEDLNLRAHYEGTLTLL